jgi:hypothetical protein
VTASFEEDKCLLEITFTPSQETAKTAFDTFVARTRDCNDIDASFVTADELSKDKDKVIARVCIPERIVRCMPLLAELRNASSGSCENAVSLAPAGSPWGILSLVLCFKTAQDAPLQAPTPSGFEESVSYSDQHAALTDAVAEMSALISECASIEAGAENRHTLIELARVRTKVP